MPIRRAMLDRYPKDWKLRSRFIRFFRARNKCEWCGVANYSIRDGSKIILTTAHVYDKRPEASQLLNLAALCQRCHNRHDMKDRIAGKKERAYIPPDIEGQYIIEFQKVANG